MTEWWKNPLLQGQENDYGDYDFYAEELPSDYARWELSKEKWHCDSCGKYSHLLLTSAHHFYCWDGWDSMHWHECWKCRLKGKIRETKWKAVKFVKKRINALKNARDFQKASSTGNFKYWYEFAMKLEK